MHTVSFEGSIKINPVKLQLYFDGRSINKLCQFQSFVNVSCIAAELAPQGRC